MDDRATVISQVCEFLFLGKIEQASSLLAEYYPFQPIEKSKGGIPKAQMTMVFVRDGFIDRYRETRPRLVFPPALRLISAMVPEQFPYHKNGKQSEGHFAYWELFPSVDHVIPRARGGLHDESNWVCCSMLTNQIKANWTLKELEWKLHEPGDFAQWDGMLNWFVHQMDKETIRSIAPKYCHDWLSAARAYAT